MKNKVFSLLLLACPVVASAQVQVSPYNPGVTAEGVTYCLPTTQIKVTVTANRHTYTPSEFCRYAERYLRLTDVSNSPEESWSIQDVSIEPVGVPDPSNMFTIRYSDKSTVQNVQLTPDGILLAINATAAPATPQPHATVARKRLNPQDYMTEEIMMAGSTAKMAELTAKEIFAIRESKNALTRGQADFMPTDGEQLRIMLENLETQEQALTLLFTGVVEDETHTYTMVLQPDKPVKQQVLMRLSNKLGVVDASNLAGSPVFLDIENLNPAPETDAPQDNSVKFAKNLKKPTSLYYRVPGKASIRIYDGRKTYLDESIPVSQFGSVEVLSSTIFSKGAAPKIVFDSTTGAILDIK